MKLLNVVMVFITNPIVSGGDWLCVPFTSLAAMRDDARGGGRGRGRGRGAGRFAGRGDWAYDDVADMVFSHGTGKDADEKGAKQREAHARDKSGRVAMQVNLLESSTVPGSEVSPVKKRPRRNGGGDDETKKTLLLDRHSPSRRVTGRNENPSMELSRARKCPGSACSSGCSEEYETRRVFSI